MLNQIVRPWTLLLVFALLLWSEMGWTGPINIGSISNQPAAEIKKFFPLASYLAKQLQLEGIDHGKVVVARSIPEMVGLFREGKVDLYIDSPFPSIVVSRASKSRFLLRRWKKGIAQYHTVIFTKKDSPISRLENLMGNMMAFEEPFSTSGYLLPKMILSQEGLKLARKSDASEPVGYGEVGYVFSNGDENTMVWVLRGKVQAGAMDNQKYLREAGRSLDNLRIVHETFPIARQIVSHRDDLPPKLLTRIKEILVKMDQSEEGKKTLENFEQTTKFDELTDQVMAPILKLQKFIEAEIAVK